jgi:hypothetical protein
LEVKWSSGWRKSATPSINGRDFLSVVGYE